jgi:hypothetical protein
MRTLLVVLAGAGLLSGVVASVLLWLLLTEPLTLVRLMTGVPVG